MEMERPLPVGKNTNSQNVRYPKVYIQSIGYTGVQGTNKKVNSILYCFIWNGKDKVKRHALISDIEMGGLKMLDIDSMICAKRVTCSNNFLEDYRMFKEIFGRLPKYLENNSR